MDVEQQPPTAPSASVHKQCHPSTLTSGVIGVTALLTGLCINQFPPPLTTQDSSKLKLNQMYHCNFSQLPNATVSSTLPNPTVWTMLIPLLLPIVYIFIKDWNIVLDKVKQQTLYHHLMGQVFSFSSSEIIRHMLVHPNSLFFGKCNLTEPACQTLVLMNLLMPFPPFNTTLLPLCPTSTLQNKEIYDSLHSVPNVNIALLGSASIFLLYHLNAATSSWTTPNPWFQLAPYCAQYKMCNRHLLKNVCLILFIVMLYIYVWHTINMYINSVPNIIVSFMYGIFVQLAILKTKKKLVSF